MDTKKLIQGAEIVICAALFVFIAYGIYLRYFIDSESFLEYAKEDGLVEYSTAFFLFFSSLVCLYRVFQYRKIKRPLWILTWAVLAFLFFLLRVMKSAGDNGSLASKVESFFNNIINKQKQIFII